MSRTLHLLIVEDSDRDLDLILRELRHAGYTPQFERVQTAEDMAASLRRQPWDLVISDHSLPQFSASGALEVLQETGLDIPFLIVSGKIGEERAVDLMKAGASDYVSKLNLARLIPVVERELREFAGRRERRRVEAELAALNAERERMLNQRSTLLDINNAVIATLDRPSVFQAIFDAVRRTLPCSGLLLTLRDAEKAGLETIALTENSVVEETGPAHDTGFAGNTRHHGPSEWVFQNQKLLVRPDLTAGLEFAGEEFMYDQGTRSYVSAPLATKGEPFGVLTLASETPGALASEDADFFARVCGQVSLALDNMLSYEQIARLTSRLERENAYLAEEIKSEHNFEEMVGSSPRFMALRERIQLVAPTDATVLVTGETGTGKELVARALHSRSLRKDKPLVKINCAAISAGLVESELFGHVKGAFTGALDRRVGRFEFADGGTLFLDEVGELPLDTQVKLLRVLQEHEFEPVGSNRTTRVDVRVIAATNRHLEEAVREGRFRADLFFRLNVVPIELPPLRERRSDIPALVLSIIRNYNRQYGRRIESIADETMERLMVYDWPGNIRELQNVLARAVVLATGSVLRVGGEFLPRALPIAVSEAPARSMAAPTPARPDPNLQGVERQHILDVLAKTHWVIEGQRGAAVLLGLNPNTLRSRMKKLGIERPHPTNV
jgi:formate hydrogenlyase transcriptional activator